MPKSAFIYGKNCNVPLNVLPVVQSCISFSFQSLLLWLDYIVDHLVDISVDGHSLLPSHQYSRSTASLEFFGYKCDVTFEGKSMA